MIRKIHFAIPVYNEEKNLEKFMASLSIALSKINLNVEIFFCLNGCTDNSKKVLQNLKSEYSDLDIKILKSLKGKIRAQNKIIKQITDFNPIFFLDADTELEQNSLKIILRELKRHEELLAVGGFPVAKKYLGRNIWKKFLDEILNIRSRHPCAEISLLDVSEYHDLALKDPQKIGTNQQHELKSKIFFHGRLFCLRSKNYWSYSKGKNVVGDDSYLPDYLIYHYGKNRIRMRYDALIYYSPFVSIKKHYKTYKRIYFDLRNLRDGYPKFEDIRNHSSLKLDPHYIQNLPFLERFKFFMFCLIRFVEKQIFKFALEKNPRKVWD